MCIDILVSAEHAKERKAKLLQSKERESKIDESKRFKIDPETGEMEYYVEEKLNKPKINPKTGEIELRYNQIPMPQDYYLVTRREKSWIQKTKEKIHNFFFPNKK